MTTRQRRLLDRARRSVTSNPSLCLDSVERLLSSGEEETELLILKARALLQLDRGTEACTIWNALLGTRPLAQQLELEAMACLLKCFDYAGIKQLLPRVAADLPDEERQIVLCIRAAQAVRESELALKLCQRLTTIAPGNPVHICKLGTLYQGFGRMEEAERAFRKALSLDPDYQPGWYFLATLRKWTADDPIRSNLEDFLQRHADTGADTRAAHYALAKVHEDGNSYDDAFQHLERGAQQFRARSGYHSSMDRKLFADLQDWFLASADDAPPDCEPDGPLFILGMPRTGSTLSDRILSSHSEISSVGELMCFRRAVEASCGASGETDFFVSFFSSAPPALPYREIGERYLAMLAPLVGQERYFIDKMPMNYVFAGLIARSLPGARFIHTVRNPMDTCFSNYKQMFGEGYYSYSYDLDDLAMHYRLYHELMAFWHSAMPDRIYDLEYEALVADPEGESRALLDWLGLGWEPRCLEFHASPGAVHTASVSQVRQPVYRGSVAKWRKFERHLKPLQQALGF
jgi:tetratricopeptide (TPR) repeat protein